MGEIGFRGGRLAVAPPPIQTVAVKNGAEAALVRYAIGMGMNQDWENEAAQLSLAIDTLCRGHRPSIALMSVLHVADVYLQSMMSQGPPPAVREILGELSAQIRVMIVAGVTVLDASETAARQ